MLLIIIFLLLGVVLFLTMNTRKEVESVKRSRRTTVLVDRKTGEEIDRKTVIDEFEDDTDADKEERNVLSQIWDKIK